MITKKVGILLTIILVAVIAIFATTTDNTTGTTNTQGITVAATFYPLYDLTKSIVGEQGQVYSIVPSGVEPHSYEPVPSDFQKLNDANAFVTLGIEFEEFEEDLIENVNPDVHVIAAGKDITLLKLDEHEEHEDEGHEEELTHEEEHETGIDHDHEEEHEEEEEGHDDHGHDHTGEDPHIWLSPKNAQTMVNNIMKGLIEADPNNEEQYRENAQTLLTELTELDEAFTQGLTNCAKDTILVNHNAFSYLARDYNFETIEISGLEPEVEPTPKQLAQLIDEAKEHDIKYVFYEELVDSRIAETIAEEVGAQTLELNPLEGTNDETATYTSLMRKNLANLQTALECQ